MGPHQSLWGALILKKNLTTAVIQTHLTTNVDKGAPTVWNQASCAPFHGACPAPSTLLLSSWTFFCCFNNCSNALVDCWRWSLHTAFGSTIPVGVIPAKLFQLPSPHAPTMVAEFSILKPPSGSSPRSLCAFMHSAFVGMRSSPGHAVVEV